MNSATCTTPRFNTDSEVNGHVVKITKRITGIRLIIYT